MKGTRHRTGSFVDRVLDGHTRIDQFEAEIEAWAAGPQTTPLHVALGLDASELLLVANSPDALRYVLHARRFGASVVGSLDSQARVRAHATLLAAEHVDPVELASLDGWHGQLAASGSDTPETAHA